MKTLKKRLIPMFLSVMMLLTLLPGGILIAQSSAPPSAYATGDIITFGSYPQTKVTDPDLITALNAQTLGADNTVTFSGSRYKRVFFTVYTNWAGGTTADPNKSDQDDNGYFINTIYWFKFEPVQWRILFNSGSELFILTEKILTSRVYYQTFAAVTWETCSLRSWLNTDFCQDAFTQGERDKIQSITIVNADNPDYSTEGGNDTTDKIFCLSYGEATNPAYGFSSSASFDATRTTQGSDFAKSSGLTVSTDSAYFGNSIWWLRTPGWNSNTACGVGSNGIIASTNCWVQYTCIGVRPACKIKLSSAIVSPESGSTGVVDYLNGLIFGVAAGTQTLDEYLQVAPGYTIECVPTVGGFGTGTAVNVKLGGETAESYRLVIFGDVNGDGNIDSSDAGCIVDYENFLLNWDPVFESARIAAGDLNGDGNVDTFDSGLIVDVENFLLTVDQTTGLALPNP